MRPAAGPAQVGAGGGNRTRVASLEGWSSTIELHPHRSPTRWRTEPASPGRLGDDGGGGWIRTTVGYANGFTVRPLSPLGHPSRRRYRRCHGVQKYFDIPQLVNF